MRWNMSSPPLSLQSQSTTPLGGGALAGHTLHCGVPLEPPGAIAEPAGRPIAILQPGGCNPRDKRRCVFPMVPTAVSAHCKAAARAARGRFAAGEGSVDAGFWPLPTSPLRHRVRPQASRSNDRLPPAFRFTLGRRVERVLPAGGAGVEPATARLRVWCSTH